MRKTSVLRRSSVNQTLWHYVFLASFASNGVTKRQLEVWPALVPLWRALDYGSKEGNASVRTAIPIIGSTFLYSELESSHYYNNM